MRRKCNTRKKKMCEGEEEKEDEKEGIDEEENKKAKAAAMMRLPECDIYFFNFRYVLPFMLSKFDKHFFFSCKMITVIS